MNTGERWTQLGSAMAGLMFIWAMFQNYFPYDLRRQLERYSHKLVSFIYPYIQITFQEYPGDGFERSKAYTAIEMYLGTNSSTHAKRLKADIVRDSQSMILSMDDHEEIHDEFQGVKVWWASSTNIPSNQTITFYPNEETKRYYKLSFHKRHREVITKYYLNHVLDQGKDIAVKTRKRKLHTNNKSNNWYGYNRSIWSHVVFQHPATFET